MNRLFAATFCIFMLLSIGCDSENDQNAPSHPAEPTLDMLHSGPGDGAEFFWWSDSGRARAAAANNRAALMVTNTDTTHIKIDAMVGLFVVPGCMGSHPDVECDIVVEDASYSQLEYGPTGLQFAEPVKLWVDSTALDLPANTYAADVAFFFYNPDTGEFEEQDTFVSPSNGHIVCEVMHFSRYILGRKVTSRN